MGMFSITADWSSDGKYIYFSSRIDPANPEWDMWRYSLEDREAQKIELNTVSFRHTSTHPDGRHIIFSTEYDYTMDSEVWVMENFLPKEKK
jgi:Tol biopolymer transport system component